MDTKRVLIDRNTVTEHGRATGIEPSYVDFLEGRAWCTEARSCTIMTIELPDTGEKRVMMAVVSLHDGKALGALVPLSAQQARSLGASLIGAADRLAKPVIQ